MTPINILFQNQLKVNQFISVTEDKVIERHYRACKHKLVEKFQNDLDSKDYLESSCKFHDKLLRALFERERKIRPDISKNVTIVACGGYGRSELAPKSDLDILFIFDKVSEDEKASFSNAILFVLWNCGCTIGSSIREVESIHEDISSNHTILTAYTETHFIAGNRKIYRKFNMLVKKKIYREGKKFFLDKQEERQKRIIKYGETRNLLEPNIKEGKGALRDLHYIKWLSMILNESLKNDHEDISLGKNDIVRYKKIKQYFMTLRILLHILRPKAQDILTFDVQPEIASYLKYQNRKNMLSVERLMRQYFYFAKETEKMVRKMDNVFYDVFSNDKSIAPLYNQRVVPKKIDTYIVQQGEYLALSVPRNVELTLDIVLDYFVTLQMKQGMVHPQTWQKMDIFSKKAHAIEYYQKDSALKLFRIMTHHCNVAPVLRAMNDCGLLGKLIPDFGRIVAQMQYDMYHVYTTDEHTLRALSRLNAIEAGLLQEEHPTASAEIKKIEQRETLYIAVFLHDIAKGRGGDHSILGAKIAYEFCPKIFLTPKQTEIAAWLVEKHLLLSNTAFKRDLDDPSTIQHFVQEVQTLEKLQLLLILTVVDITAVGPKTWNNWKASLIRKLFLNAIPYFIPDLNFVDDEKSKYISRKESLRQKLSGEKHYLLDIATPSYLLSCDDSFIEIHHALVMDNERDPSCSLSIDITDFEKSDYSLVSVYAPNFIGLMSKLAGALTLCDINVVDARINTFSNGMALDYFVIQSDEGKAIISQDGAKKITMMIKGVLEGKTDIEVLLKKKLCYHRHRTDIFTVKPSINIFNKMSKDYTVIEIKGRNRQGLLYAITKKTNRFKYAYWLCTHRKLWGRSN